ncbi:MAG: hypothetical protein ACI4O3_01035, partial [Oscillospiraceae bacterium]
FGGTVISNADVGYQGRTAEHARNQIANIHGGMVKLGDQWYISYHRHTHGRQFSRQGCMEPITIDKNGSIAQVECTSFGLSGGKAPAKGSLPAWCACNLYKGEGGVFIRFSRERTVEAPYVVVEDEGYVTNITDTGVVGWRYLIFDGEERELSLHVRGRCRGTLSVCLSDTDGEVAGKCPVSLEDGQNWTEVTVPIRAVSGERPLRLLYSGEGTLELLKVTVR